MKGFTKDGKFRPTGNRNKSSLSKKDLLNIKIQDKIDLATDGGVGLHKISVLRDEIADLEEHRDSMRDKKTLDTPDDRFAKSLTKYKKEWEKALEEHFKDDPKFKGQKWDVDITYTGNNGNLEMFSFTAQPESWKGGNHDKKNEGGFFSESSWISNDEWMETGDEEENDKLEKLYAKDDQKAEDDYTDWMTSTFEIAEDGWYLQLLDAIEDELMNSK